MLEKTESTSDIALKIDYTLIVMFDHPVQFWCRILLAVASALILLLCTFIGAAEKADEPSKDIVSIAQLEIQNLISAMQMAEIFTSHYYSLENLDDIPASFANPSYNYIHDGGGTYAVQPFTGRFRIDRLNLVNSTFPTWSGPYITYQQGRTDDTDFWNFDIGTPLDPWDTPYYFYTPLGLVQPPNSITQSFYGDQFDRYAIVSHGPNGKKGGSDDIIFVFGSPPTVTTLSSIPTTANIGKTIKIRGYNMGTQGGNIELTFNGQPVTTGIVSWTATEIQKNDFADGSDGSDGRGDRWFAQKQCRSGADVADFSV